ncbi:MAG: type IV pilin protein [Sumerlaeia bacterium]
MQKKALINNVRKQGFTLIELLIVVAIIAILAAIAVPNFLEAQVRSKISRARADMRTVVTAAEIYYVDHNKYPRTLDGVMCPGDPLVDDCDGHGNLRDSGFLTVPFTITTPIAYITSLPRDVFKIGKSNDFASGASVNLPYESGDNRDMTFLYLDMVQASDPAFGFFDMANPDANEQSYNPTLARWGLYQIRSLGPASSYDGPNDVDFTHPVDNIYDATNGTVSFGHIIRNQRDPEGKP